MGRGGFHPYIVERSDPLLRRSRWYRPLPGRMPAPGTPLAGWLPALPFERAVLMPCSDSWVREVASLDGSLRARFPASTPTPETLERFVDKGRFAELLCECGTPHPFTKIVDVPADLASVSDEIFASAILKPRDSQRFMQRFGVKACHIETREHGAAKLATLTDEGFSMVLQEYIPGPPTHHYFVDGFVDRFGEVRGVFVRQRLRMYPLDFGNSTYMVSVPREEAAPAVASITSLLRHAGYRGMFSAEFKRDARDGIFKLLEVNARAWWYVDFAARCGVNVCRMAYDDALEHPVTAAGDYRVGCTLVYPYLDYFACLEMRRRGQLSWWRGLQSWLGAKQPVFKFRDPAPGLISVTKTLGAFGWSRVRALLSMVSSGVVALFHGA